MSPNQEPPSASTDHEKEKRVGDAEKAGTTIENVICVDVEYPHQVASKNHVPLRKYGSTALEPLCPTGIWKAVYCFFFLGCLVAVTFFIIDINRHK